MEVLVVKYCNESMNFVGKRGCSFFLVYFKFICVIVVFLVLLYNFFDFKVEGSKF